MNLQSYGYLQRSTDMIDVQNYPIVQEHFSPPSNTALPRNTTETIINLHHGNRPERKPPIQHNLEKSGKLQRRTSAKMTRPLGLTMQKSNESIRLRKVSNGSENLNNGRRNSVGINPPGTPNLQREGTSLQRSESVQIQRLAIGNDRTGTPQKNRVRRNVSLNSPRTTSFNNRPFSNTGINRNIPALAIDNTFQNQITLRQNSDLLNPYKRVVPKPQLHKSQLTQGATNSTANFTQSIELINVESFPTSKGNELGILVSSKSIDPSFFDSKTLQLVSQSAIEGTNREKIDETNSSGAINGANITNTMSTYQLQQSEINFVKSMDTIRLSTVTFGATESQLLSSQTTFLEPQVSDGEPQTTHSRHRVVPSLKVAPKTLHSRRGISNRDRFDNHPLPEHQEEVLSQFTRNTLYDDISNYDAPAYSIPTAAVNSGRSSPSQTVESDTTRSWTDTAEGWQHGNTTERSSEFSLEDEFDRRTALQVRELFEEIDTMLFERHPEKKHHLNGECKEWVGQFPHMRILGNQLLSPQDHGFVVIPGDDSQPPYNSGNLGLLDITEHDITTGHTLNELTISGQRVDAKHPSPHHFTSMDQVGGDPSWYAEETFEEDGQIEDIIAVDFSSVDEDVKSNVTRRGRGHGLPPMTPQACMKDNLHGAVFDFIWTEFISWLRPINNQFVNNIIQDTIVSAAEQRRNEQPNQFIIQDHVDEDDEEMSTPRQHRNFPLMLASSPPREFMHPPSREASTLSTSRDKNVKGVASGTQVGLKADTKKSPELAGVLTVSSKAIQSREKSTLQDSTDLFGTVAMRPHSSLTKMNLQQPRPGSMKMDHTRNPSAQRIRSSMPGSRLRPLPLERAKTPNVEDDISKRLQYEVIKGHKISTPSDHFAPLPTIPQHRNGQLPPINSIEREISENNISVRTDRKTTVANSPQRASSAVSHDKENRLTSRELSFKERPPAVPVQLENRPSTTHAFRSDSSTPFGIAGASGRRSNTPMAQAPIGLASIRNAYNPSSGLGNIPQGVPTGLGGMGSSGFLGGGGTLSSDNMQITGNSISTPVDENNELEDADHFDDFMHSAHWGCRLPPLGSGNPYFVTRKNHLLQQRSPSPYTSASPKPTGSLFTP